MEINDNMQNGEFEKVLHSNDIEEASAIFSDIFGSILNRHAPLRTVQVRSNYVPWISSETKQLQKIRDITRKEAIDENSTEKFEIYKKTAQFYCEKTPDGQKRLLQDKILSGKPVHI